MQQKKEEQVSLGLPRILPDIEVVSSYSWDKGAGAGENVFRTALSHWNAHRYDQALQSYEEAINIGLTSLYEAAARMNMGKILLKQGDVGAAANQFQEVLTISPQQASTVYDSAVYLAVIYEELGMMEDMRKAVEVGRWALNHVDYTISAQAANEVRKVVRQWDSQ
jgi:Tfp pilus assembly protein PilF